MKRLLAFLLLLPLAVTALFVTAGPAAAATLTRVTGFGANPTNLGMYLYVPDAVAPKPALLVLVHYCGGSASAIFNGNGHDYATAADRYGYLVVVPEATRDGHCFDVSTKAGLTRDGGSDTTGIMAMVAWTRQHYNVDPGRIVVSGFSSGAMMTNVLAAQYPDVFSAGSAFSGVPAGCFATTDGSLWNSQCAGGNVVKSAQQWADQAHAMYPGYAGAYPRMQLWHGNQDTTLAYPNYGEEIKQWTALRGLSQTPSATDHPQSSWTRNRYGDAVEGITIAGTGHTLPQAGMIGIRHLVPRPRRRWRDDHRRSGAVGGRGPVSRRAGPVDHPGHPAAGLGLPRRHEPDVDGHRRRGADRLLRWHAALPGRGGR